MKVTGIEVVELRVPGWQGLTFDGSYDNCIVEVHTDEGITGIAEVDSVPSVIRAIIEAQRSHTHAMGLKSVLIGRDPTDVEARGRNVRCDELLWPPWRCYPCHQCT